MENALQRNASRAFGEGTPRSTNLTSREGLCRRLRKSPEARARFVESHLNKELAFQLRSLRDNAELSQDELAAKVGMTQNAISRLENPNYGRATLSTLKRLAATYDVGLVIRFVPFSKLINWVSGTPYLEPGLSSESMDVPSFEKEEKQGALENVPHTKQIPAVAAPNWSAYIFGMPHHGKSFVNTTVPVNFAPIKPTGWFRIEEPIFPSPSEFRQVMRERALWGNVNYKNVSLIRASNTVVPIPDSGGAILDAN